MRISDWSSDVCSSDLPASPPARWPAPPSPRRTGTGWRRPRGSPASATGWEARSQEPHHRPACQADKTEQHHERISIYITRLQPDREPGAPLDERRGAIGTEAVDSALVSALPEEAADHEGGLHEQQEPHPVETPLRKKRY